MHTDVHETIKFIFLNVVNILIWGINLRLKRNFSFKLEKAF